MLDHAITNNHHTIIHLRRELLENAGKDVKIMKDTAAAWLFEQGTRRKTMAPNFQLRLFDESADLENVVRFYNDIFGPLRPYYSWPITLERFRDKVLSCWEYRREGFWIARQRIGRLKEKGKAGDE